MQRKRVRVRCNLRPQKTQKNIRKQLTVRDRVRQLDRNPLRCVGAAEEVLQNEFVLQMRNHYTEVVEHGQKTRGIRIAMPTSKLRAVYPV